MEHDKSRVVLFVGGPEDGTVIKGEDAIVLTMRPETLSDGSAKMVNSQIGTSLNKLSTRLFNAMNVLGQDEALIYFQRYGVSEKQQGMNKYTLSVIQDGLFVFKYAGDST